MKKLKDANFIGKKYLPAAGASVFTDAFDLGASEGDPGPSLCDVELIVAALANNIDATKTILVELYDSEDGENFSETAPLIQCKVPGVADGGSEETKFYFRFPPQVRRFVALKITVPAGAGDNTAEQLEWALLL